MNSNFGSFDVHEVGCLACGTSIMTQIPSKAEGSSLWFMICTGIQELWRILNNVGYMPLLLQHVSSKSLYFVSAHQRWPSHLTTIADTTIRSIPDIIAKLRIGALGETLKGKCLHPATIWPLPIGLGSIVGEDTGDSYDPPSPSRPHSCPNKERARTGREL
jgi:hypothetical protein